MRSIYSTLFTVCLWMTVPVVLIESKRPAQAQASDRIEAFTIEGQLDRSSEVMEDGSYLNRHTFEGRAGQQVVINLVSDAFDTYLILQDPNGQKIAENDDGSDTNARIIITLPLTGTYTVLANSYKAATTGEYRLSLRAATERDVALQEADRLFQQGMEPFSNNQFQAAISLFQQALAAYQALGERVAEAKTLNRMGQAYDNSQYPQVLEQYQQALAISIACR